MAGSRIKGITVEIPHGGLPGKEYVSKLYRERG